MSNYPELCHRGTVTAPDTSRPGGRELFRKFNAEPHRLGGRYFTDDLGAESAVKFFEWQAFKVQLERLLNAFEVPGMTMKLNGWTPGKIVKGKLQPINATKSTPYEDYSPFLQVELSHGQCRAELSLAMSVAVSPIYMWSSMQWYSSGKTGKTPGPICSSVDMGGCADVPFTKWIQNAIERDFELPSRLRSNHGRNPEIQPIQPQPSIRNAGPRSSLRYDFARHEASSRPAGNGGMGYCRDHACDTAESGLQEDIEEKKKDIRVALKQCAQLFENPRKDSFCNKDTLVSMRVYSMLKNDEGTASSSAACRDWFPRVDSALRAKINAVRNYYSDAFLRDCELLNATLAYMDTPVSNQAEVCDKVLGPDTDKRNRTNFCRNMPFTDGVPINPDATPGNPLCQDAPPSLVKAVSNGAMTDCAQVAAVCEDPTWGTSSATPNPTHLP